MSKYHSFNKARRRSFAPQPTFANPTSPSYNGDLVTPFLTPALKSGDTLANGFVRTIDGITNKAVIQTTSVADDVLLAGGTGACAFASGDSVTLSESVLTLSDVKVNEEMCRAVFLPSWVSQRGSRINSDAASNEFRNFLLATVSAKVAEAVENNIWKGSTTANLPVGFLSTDTVLDNAGWAASRIGSAGAITQNIAELSASNVITQIGLVYQQAAESKPAILNKPDTRIFVSNKTAALYRQALATSGGALTSDTSDVVTYGVGTGYNAQVTNQALTGLNFLGIQIAECSGMFDDCIVIAQTENLVVGSNLMTDLTTVNYIPTYQYDGSDNVRIVMQFGLGMQVGIGSDIVVGAQSSVFTS